MIFAYWRTVVSRTKGVNGSGGAAPPACWRVCRNVGLGWSEVSGLRIAEVIGAGLYLGVQLQREQRVLRPNHR